MSAKLRASCNACHDAKVKCVKVNGARKSCTRCDSLKQVCRYSLNLPRVYRKRRKLSCSTTPPNSTKDAIVATTSTISPDETDASPPNTLSTNGILNLPIDNGYDLLLSTLLSPSKASPSSGEIPWLPPSLAKTDHSADNSISHHYNSLSEVFPSELTSDGPIVLDYALPSRREAHLLHWPQESFSPDVEAVVDLRAQPIKIPLVESSATQCTLESSHEPKGETWACECLNLLQLSMRSLSSNIVIPIPAFDSILTANRNAVQDCQVTLRYMCQPKALWFSTILCGLLDLVLSSYSSGFHVFAKSLDTPRLDDETCQSGKKHHQRSANAVKLSLGSFDLENEDQIIYVSRHVEREIRKVEDLLHKLLELDDGNGISSAAISHLLHRCKAVNLGIQTSLITSSGSEFVPGNW